jgi:hypothetical protein
MAFFYASGEEIRKGDKVLLHGEPGEIEFVGGPGNDPDDRFQKEHGRGVMILEPKSFGRLFLADTQDYEDLELVSRG